MSGPGRNVRWYENLIPTFHNVKYPDCLLMCWLGRVWVLWIWKKS